MANKTFKARFKQLIAPLSSWTTGDKKDFKILPGEIAFATAAIAGVESGEEPVVLFKVNYTDAEATWGNLEYSAYANAQDVHAWAKQAGITVDEDPNSEGTFISGIAWNDDKLVITRSKITTADIDGLEAYIQGIDTNTTYTLTGAGNKLVLTPSEGSANEIAVEGTGAASVTVDGDKITIAVTKEASATEAGLLSTADKAKIDKLVVNPDGTIGGTIEKAGTAEKVEHSLTIAGESFNGLADVEITADEIYTAIADKDKNETFAISYDKDEKKIFLTGSNGTNSAIPTDDFIKDGMIESVVPSEDGKSLVITWNTDAEKEQSVTTISLSALVDAYTGGTTDDIIVSISDQNVITAVLTEDIKTELAKATAKARTFAAGDVLDVEDKDGVITYSHEAIAAPTGTAGSGRTYLTGVSTDGHGHITGFTTATESDQAIPEYGIASTELAHAGGTTFTHEIYLTKDGEKVTGTSATCDLVMTGSTYSATNPIALKDYVDGLVGSDIQTLSVSGGESNAAVVRLSNNGGFFTLQGDDTTHITVDPIDEMSIIQIKHNTHEVVAPAPVEVGVDRYGHVAIGNNLQFTDSYAIDNPIATKTYVDTKTHNIEDLTQVDYVIFDANI